MKLILASTALIGLTNALNSLSQLNFDEWKLHHDIKFESVGEDKIRRQHFERAKEFVITHNMRYDAGEESFDVALNRFAAMPNEEFLEKYTQTAWEAGTYGQDDPTVGVSQYNCPEKYTSTSHSGSYDGKSYVTGVKDQGSCGSCWAFGAGAAVEGAYCKGGKKSCGNWNGVSAQQLVDCASSNSALNPYGNSGCNGGFQSNALKYIFDYEHGIESWDDYGYETKQGSCRYKSNKSIGSIKSCGRLGTKSSQDNMCAMIQNKGITTVAIDASGAAFQLYSSGIYTGGTCSSTRLNHAVTATGFNSNSLYIKNSWGKTWGDKGYIYFAKDGRTNTCGVYSEGQYAIL